MFSTGNVQQQQAQAPAKKFIGFGLFQVAAINPTQEQFETMFGRKVENWRGYNYKTDAGESARVLFILKDAQHPDSPLFQYSVFLRRQTRKNKDGNKTQVIDKYGNTAWVTDDEFKSQIVPKSKNGNPLSIIPPYRPCCDGEDKLVDFLRSWLYTDNPFRWDGSSMIVKNQEELKNCEVQLDHLKDYWAGDFSELQALVSMPNMDLHRVNALLLLRDSQFNGKSILVQDMFWKVTPEFLGTTRIEKEFNREVALGLHSNKRFDLKPMYEFLGYTPQYANQPGQPTQPLSPNEQAIVDSNVSLEQLASELPF